MVIVNIVKTEGPFITCKPNITTIFTTTKISRAQYCITTLSKSSPILSLDSFITCNIINNIFYDKWNPVLTNQHPGQVLYFLISNITMRERGGEKPHTHTNKTQFAQKSSVAV